LIEVLNASNEKTKKSGERRHSAAGVNVH